MPRCGTLSKAIKTSKIKQRWPSAFKTQDWSVKGLGMRRCAVFLKLYHHQLCKVYKQVLENCDGMFQDHIERVNPRLSAIAHCVAQMERFNQPINQSFKIEKKLGLIEQLWCGLSFLHSLPIKLQDCLLNYKIDKITHLYF